MMAIMRPFVPEPRSQRHKSNRWTYPNPSACGERVGVTDVEIDRKTALASTCFARRLPHSVDALSNWAKTQIQPFVVIPWLVSPSFFFPSFFYSLSNHEMKVCRELVDCSAEWAELVCGGRFYPKPAARPLPAILTGRQRRSADLVSSFRAKNGGQLTLNDPISARRTSRARRGG
ncbi:hypothetical protein BaRGS_00034459 [Batillaria attramentaria]|uniref:Uncharacterized protein n=1 Tax=Batillaria attramentaria TaxID=370345 RepID=A0ABD0JHD6_9CAEN